MKLVDIGLQEFIIVATVLPEVVVSVEVVIIGVCGIVIVVGGDLE